MTDMTEILDNATFERLKALRGRIDAIDTELLALLQERIRVARQIGEIKRGASRQPLDPVREKEVITRVLERNEGFFPPDGLTSIFGEIISACRNAQRPAVVGYLGPETTFTHMAAVRFFGTAPTFSPLGTSSRSLRKSSGKGSIMGWCRWKIPLRGPWPSPWMACMTFA